MVKRVKNDKTSKTNKKQFSSKKKGVEKVSKNFKEEVGEVEEKGNNADFYLDDADLDLAEDDNTEDEKGSAMSNSEQEGGSELDFGEDDYIESESEAEEEEEEEKKPKEKKITKAELKKILKKCKEGVPMAITRMIIIFTKITSSNQKPDSLDDDNIYNKPKIVQKLLKFCIKNLAEILVLKLHSISQTGIKENSLNDRSSVVKNLIKRYLATLSKYVRNTEKSMLAFIYKNMSTISELIMLYRNYIEIFVKSSIKVWASRHGFMTSTYAYRFVKEVLEKKPEHFENALKYFYINYLDVAKAMNWNTIKKIEIMQDELVSILSLDLQKAYITIFTFIRKLCLQLRMTITDKKASSIKNIYNWQFVNSLKLWSKVVAKYYKNKNSDINLLAYPLIQTILGVLRLNLVDTFFPLRICLVKMLNEISHSTQIYIPVSNYLVEILESSHFKGKYKDKNVTQDLNKNSSPDINVNLKLKPEDFKNYGYVTSLLEETLDCLHEFLSINSFKFSFPEIAFGITYQDKSFREMVKSVCEKIKTHSEMVETKRKESGIYLLQTDKVVAFESEMKTTDQNELIRFLGKLKTKRAANIESRMVQKQDKFIEI